MTIVSVLLAILLLAILIVIHELGHFTAARLMHIDVREFAVGFGPKLIGWKSRKYETTFAVRLIPLGGYCAFYGEDDTKGISKDDPRAFQNHGVGKRIVTILMGPVMNFVLAFVVGIGFFWISGVQEIRHVTPYISGVTEGGVAYTAGLKPGDIVEEAGGTDLTGGTLKDLQAAIRSWQEGDGPLVMKVRRGEESLTLEMTPVWDEKEERYLVGIYIGDETVETVPTDFFGAVGASAETCWNVSGVILEALKNLITRGEGLDQTAGPVGVIQMVSESVREGGLFYWIQLLMLISVNLGLMNLLPIPGLDGSRLVFGLIEVIRRKPVPPEKEAMVHLVGMVFLFGLMIFFTFKDIMKLFG